MKLRAQLVWIKKAGALTAFSGLFGPASPAFATSWAASLPVASTMPVSHIQPTHHLSTLSVTVPASHHTITNAANTAIHAATVWHGQQLNTILNSGVTPTLNRSLFAPSGPAGISGPGLQLDLTTTNATIVLGSNLFQASSNVTISLSGHSQTFSSGDKVTPAEYVAIRQILNGGIQSLNLNTQGAAVGGSFRLDTASAVQVGELVIPRNVTVLDYANSANNPIVSGDILNYGTIYGVTTRSQSSPVSLNALDIVNERGGLITTQLSASMVHALGGVITNTNLMLTAGDTISNAGIISGSGSVALVSGSGNLVNSGLIAADTGNITITSPGNTPVNINGSGGTFQALKGDITIRDASYAGSGNVTLNGGDYLSRNFNIYSGTGTITGAVGQLTGMLNTVATADHLDVSTANLILGKNTVSDPTFVNSDPNGGNILISGVNTFGEDVAVIATGNITADATGQIVDSGNAVTLIAGAVVTSGGPTTTTLTGAATSQVIINATATSGIGLIDLSASKATNVIDTSSAAGAGGKITLLAYNGSVTTANTSSINATGGGSNKGGDVTIIATDGITVGSIATSGGSAGGTGGAISLTTSTPTSNDSNPIAFSTNGAITTGNMFTAPAPTSDSFSRIQVNGNLVSAPLGQTGSTASAGTAGGNAGAISLSAGSSITTQSILAFGGGGAGGAASSVNGGAGGNGAAVSLTTANGSINVVGDINTSGGGGGGGGSTGAAGGTGGAGGSAGAITVSANAAPMSGSTPPIAISGSTFASSGGSGGAGSVAGAGGGGASYGGGGGGGAGASAAAAGGAGYFGGGGADISAAGGGGGVTGGQAGSINATAGTSSTGGTGAGDGNGTTSAGGILTATVQGGAGVGIGGTTGSNVNITSGGGAITIGGPGTTSIGGQLAGNSITLNTLGFTFNGTATAVTAVDITASQGQVNQASLSDLITAPSINIALGTSAGQNIGTSTIPLNTTAGTLVVSGTADNLYVNAAGSQGSTLQINTTGVTSLGRLLATTTSSNITIDLKGLPTNLQTLSVNTGSNATTGGTIEFAQGGPVSLANAANVALTANNIGWSNYGSTALTLSADSTTSTGGSIAITTNLLNNSSNFTIGSNAGQIALSANGNGATGTAGAISLIAPTSNVSLTSGALTVNYSGVATTGKGGSIILNVMSLQNSSAGVLTLNANGIGSGSGGIISITTNTAAAQTLGSSASGIILSALNGGASGTTQTGGSLTFINLGSGSLTVSSGALSTTVDNGATVNGGSITLSAASILNGTANTPLVLNQDGFGAGNGGRISLTETAKNNSLVLLGTASGDTYAFSAVSGLSGGNGGTVTLSTQDNLQFTADSVGNVIGNGLGINIAPQSTNGSGGIVNVTALDYSTASNGSNATVFNVAGIGTGNGGQVRLTQLDPNTILNIGKGAGQMEFIANNGATGTSSGRVFIVVNNTNTLSTPNVYNGTGGIVVDPTAILLTQSAKTGSNINGGLLELDGPTVTQASTVSTKTAMILNVNGIGTGAGGSIIFEESNANASPVIGTKAGQVELFAASGAKGVSGGTITVIGGDNLTVAPAAISVKASSVGSGGFISLSAENFSDVLDGTHGNLLVTGALTVNAGAKVNAGNISLQSNSSLPFNIGLASKNSNGIAGGVSLTGGSGLSGGNLSISTNGSGGITLQSAISTPRDITITFAAGATGNVNVNTAIGGTKTNKIDIQSLDSSTNNEIAGNIIGGTAGKLITSVTDTTASIFLLTQGNISGSTTVTKGVSTTKELQIVATSLSAIALGDIDVNAAIALKSVLTLDQFSAGGDAVITSAGGLTTLGFTGGVTQNALVRVNDGSTFLQQSLIVANASTDAASGGGGAASAGGSISIGAKGSESGTFDANHITIGLDNSITKVVVNAPTLTFGNLTFNTPNSGTKMMLANFAPQISSNASATYTIGADAKNGYTVDSDHSMVLTGSFGTPAVSLSLATTTAGSSITGSAVLSTKAINLTTNGGDVGASGTGNGIQLNTSSLTVNTGTAGSAYLDSLGKTTLVVTSSTVGSFNLTTTAGATVSGVTSDSGDVSITTKGVTVINNIISAGAINILGGSTTTIGTLTNTAASAGDIDVQTTTGVLQTSSNAVISAPNGGILFENQNTKSGSIIIGVGSDIETGKSGGTGGQITLTIGYLDTPTLGTFTSPNVTQSTTNGGQIYWGTAGITALVSSKVGNIVTAKGTNVIFNTGSLKATAIKLDGKTTIIADPPVSAAEIAAMQAAASSPASATLPPTELLQVTASPLPLTTSVTVSGPNSSADTVVQSTNIGQTLASTPAIFATNTKQLSDTFEITPALLNVMPSHLQGGVNEDNFKDASLTKVADTDARWISESEMDGGIIPATIIGRDDLNIHSNISSVLDISESTATAPHAKLNRGSALLLPQEDSTIQTPFGSLNVAAKSMVLVLCLKDSLAIYNFNDCHKGAVQLSIGKNKFAIAPGQHLLLSSTNSKDFQDVNAAQLFTYRNVRSQSLEDGLTARRAFTAQFNVVRALSAVAPIKQLMISNAPNAKQLSQKLLKTSAIITQLSAGGAAYEPMPRRNMLALR